MWRSTGMWAGCADPFTGARHESELDYVAAQERSWACCRSSGTSQGEVALLSRSAILLRTPGTCSAWILSSCISSICMAISAVSWVINGDRDLISMAAWIVALLSVLKMICGASSPCMIQGLKASNEIHTANNSHSLWNAGASFIRAHHLAVHLSDLVIPKGHVLRSNLQESSHATWTSIGLNEDSRYGRSPSEAFWQSRAFWVHFLYQRIEPTDCMFHLSDIDQPLAPSAGVWSSILMLGHCSVKHCHPRSHWPKDAACPANHSCRVLQLSHWKHPGIAHEVIEGGRQVWSLALSHLDGDVWTLWSMKLQLKANPLNSITVTAFLPGYL